MTNFLTFILLNPDLPIFDNTVDPEQLAHNETIWSGYIFSTLIEKYMFKTGTLHFNRIKLGRGVVHNNIQHSKG